MDLVKAWAAAAVTYVVGSVATVLLVPVPEDLDPIGARIRYVTVPVFVLSMLVAAVGAYAHRRAADRTRRHLLAVLAVPVVVLAVAWVWWIVQGAEPLDMALGTAAQTAGTITGWLVIDRLTGRSATSSPY